MPIHTSIVIGFEQYHHHLIAFVEKVKRPSAWKWNAGLIVCNELLKFVRAIVGNAISEGNNTKFLLHEQHRRAENCTISDRREIYLDLVVLSYQSMIMRD